MWHRHRLRLARWECLFKTAGGSWAKNLVGALTIWDPRIAGPSDESVNLTLKVWTFINYNSGNPRVTALGECEKKKKLNFQKKLVTS